MFSVRTVKRKVLYMVRIVNTEKNNVFFYHFSVYAVKTIDFESDYSLQLLRACC